MCDGGETDAGFPSSVIPYFDYVSMRSLPLTWFPTLTITLTMDYWTELTGNNVERPTSGNAWTYSDTVHYGEAWGFNDGMFHCISTYTALSNVRRRSRRYL
jgi:hypothetical protein